MVNGIMKGILIRIPWKKVFAALTANIYAVVSVEGNEHTI